MRNSFIDNAKVILITLVVLGHLMSGLLGRNEIFDAAYMLIYTFHMPAFVYLTGVLSKKCLSAKQFWKMILTLLVPYVIFQVIYTAYYEIVYSEPIEFDWLLPRMALWYLLSLFMWRVMLWFFPKNVWSVIAAIAISLIAGYFENVNDWASISRTLFFFAYFMAGHTYGVAFIENKANQLKNRLMQLTGGVVGLWVVLRMNDVQDREWLLGRSSYYELTPIFFDVDSLNRVVVYVISFVMLFAFLACVPKKRYWFTKYGSRTLAVYLLHLFIVKIIKESSWYIEIGATGSYWMLIVPTVLITYVLSQTIFTKLLTPIRTFNAVKNEGLFRNMK